MSYLVQQFASSDKENGQPQFFITDTETDETIHCFNQEEVYAHLEELFYPEQFDDGDS